MCRNCFSRHFASGFLHLIKHFLREYRLSLPRLGYGNSKSDIAQFFYLIYPLTARVVGAPQMISQPVSSIFSLFPTALWDLANSRPVYSLMFSSHLFLCLPCLLPPFTVPFKMVLARPDKRETWPYHCSLRLFTVVFVWSNSLLDLGTDFLVGNMVCVGDAWYLAVAPHFHGLYSSLELCCEGPWFAGIQENGCDTVYNGLMFTRLPQAMYAVF